jgi:hypothetical protein
MKPYYEDGLKPDLTQFTVREIPKEQTYEWLLKKHYARRIPQIQYAFGLYDGSNILTGVCTFGLPPNQNLALMCGDEYKDNLLELNRLVLSNNERNIASYFITKCFKLLPLPKIIVSYSDPNNGHHGYIYQALNGIYTGYGGEAKEYIFQNKRYNSRHIKNYWFESRGVTFNADKTIDEQFMAIGDIVKEVEPKHRYVFFLGSKRQKKDMLANLKYDVLPYPKGDNQKYDASYEPPKQGVLV